MLDLADDHVDVLTRLRIHASFQQPSGGEDRSQRVAQLVREEREEFVLSAIGSAECVLDRALAGHVRDRVDQAWHAVDLALRAREDDSDDSPVLGALGDLETPLRRRGAAQRFENAARSAADQSPSSTEVLPIISSREKPKRSASASLMVRNRPSASRVMASGCGLNWKTVSNSRSDDSHRVLGRAPVVDVERRAEPPNDVAARVSYGSDAREMPPILAARGANPGLDLGRLRRLEGASPATHRLVSIVRVDRVEGEPSRCAFRVRSCPSGRTSDR